MWLEIFLDEEEKKSLSKTIDNFSYLLLKKIIQLKSIEFTYLKQKQKSSKKEKQQKNISLNGITTELHNLKNAKRKKA